MQHRKKFPKTFTRACEGSGGQTALAKLGFALLTSLTVVPVCYVACSGCGCGRAGGRYSVKPTTM